MELKKHSEEVLKIAERGEAKYNEWLAQLRTDIEAGVQDSPGFASATLRTLSAHRLAAELLLEKIAALKASLLKRCEEAAQGKDGPGQA